MNQEQNPVLDREQSQEMDYRLVQRLFFCYQCNQHFKKLLPRSQTPQCPKCNQQFIEEVTPANRKEFAEIKNESKEEASEGAQNEFKERDHNEGYRMVFNSPESQQAFQTRLNPHEELKSQTQASNPAPPRQQPQSSFVQYSTTSVNGRPVRQQVFLGGPPGQNQPAGPFGDPFGSIGFFNIFDSMNQIFSPIPQAPAQVNLQQHRNQESKNQESSSNTQSQMPGAQRQPSSSGGFPWMGFPFGGGMPMSGMPMNGMNTNFFNMFAMPDMSQFMGFNPTNFRQNYNSNFRSSGDFMFDLAQYLSELQGMNERPRATSKETLKKLPEIEIDEAHCKKGDDGKIELPSCTVCQEEFALGNKGMLLPCGHIFHKECLTPWLTSHNTCPVCRFELPLEE